MKNITLISLLLLSVATLRAQDKTTNDAAPAGCENTTALVKQAWDIEGKLMLLAQTAGPATQVRELGAKGRTLLKQMFGCSFQANIPQEWSDARSLQRRDFLSAEYLNLQFIVGAQLENGGLAQGPGIEPGSFPLDLGLVAPSCKDVVETKLVQRIEGFAREHREPAGLKVKDTLPLYAESAKLPLCAGEAQRAGYKDAAIRIMSAALRIETSTFIADTNEQAAITKIIQSAPLGSSVPVQVGPNHCTASIQDWGFQKTINWDCY